MIAQHRIPDETTETTQVRELLEPVDLENAVVTADAAHAHRETAEYIAGSKDDGNRESDYFLFVKGNQPSLQRAIYHAVQHDGPHEPDHTEVDYGHGRIIRRSIWGTDAGNRGLPARRPRRADPPRRLRHHRHADQQGNRARRHQPGRRPCQRGRPREDRPRPVGHRIGALAATRHTRKTRTLATPETARRSWPRSGIWPSACSTSPALPRSPAPSRPSDATEPECSTTYRYEAHITNDFADPVRHGRLPKASRAKSGAN